MSDTVIGGISFGGPYYPRTESAWAGSAREEDVKRRIAAAVKAETERLAKINAHKSAKDARAYIANQIRGGK